MSHPCMVFLFSLLLLYIYITEEAGNQSAFALREIK